MIVNCLAYSKERGLGLVLTAGGIQENFMFIYVSLARGSGPL